MRPETCCFGWNCKSRSESRGYLGWTPPARSQISLTMNTYSHVLPAYSERRQTECRPSSKAPNDVALHLPQSALEPIRSDKGWKCRLIQIQQPQWWAVCASSTAAYLLETSR